MIRKPLIKIELDQWDWTNGKMVRSKKDVTSYVRSFSFTRSIKSPAGQATFTVLPQMEAISVLDALNTMDVIRVYEFNILKYQGYIYKIAYSAFMTETAPQRSAIITTYSMGNLLATGKLGLNMGAVTKNDLALADGSYALFKAINDDVTAGAKFTKLITTVIDNWLQLLSTLGVNTYKKYIETYFDLVTGLSASNEPVFPKSYDLYSGSEESLSLWDILQQLIEVPLNEVWFDTGGRTVSINGSKKELPEDKEYLIFRQTPFNDSVGMGSTTARTDLPTIKVDLDHLTRFDFAKSMEEVYTLFASIPSVFDPGDKLRVLLGQVVYDLNKMGKYLYRPLITQLKFIRTQNLDGTKLEKPTSIMADKIKNLSQTLMNWFIKNDEYINGVVTLHVPADKSLDPRIGQKITVEGIRGTFYVEAVAHKWSYGKDLISNLSVTRGYNDTSKKPMEFKDRIFTRSIT